MCTKQRLAAILREMPQRDVDALVKYVSKNGRYWRSHLVHEWESGSNNLRRIRNSLGPSGIYKIAVFAGRVRTLRAAA
jgi:hypothetical protein